MELRREDLESPPGTSLSFQKIVDITANLSRNLTELFKTLHELILNLDNMDNNRLKAMLRFSREIDEKIDSLKNDALYYISKVSLGFLEREDWLRLLLKLSGVTDKILGVMYRLEQLFFNKWSIPPDIKERLIELSSTILKMIDYYEKAISLTGINTKKAFETCKELELLERKADELYRRLNFLIIASNKPFQEVLLLKDIAEMLEEISDTIDSATDDLRVILVNLL